LDLYSKLFTDKFIIMQKTNKRHPEYQYHVTLFCSGNIPHDKADVEAAEIISRGIAKRDFVLVNGASKEGLMGVTGKSAYKNGGKVYGVGIKDYEPDIYEWFHNWEGYSSYEHRIKRLTDLGDVFIALNGGLGTLHEILTIHINQLLGKEKRPIIILEPMAKLYRELCQEIKLEGLYWEESPEHIYYAANASEALSILDRITSNYRNSNYINKLYYPACNAREIYEDVATYTETYQVLYEQQKLTILPGVFPPNRFRTSSIFGKLIKELDLINKTVFDIGCGPGNLSILAAKQGAQSVVAVDKNAIAVQNTKLNVAEHRLDNVVVHHGSVFDSLKNQKADVIFFNPPFHKDQVKQTDTDLIHSVLTNNFEVLIRFFANVDSYLKPNGSIYLAFSNKDQVALEKLEHLMSRFKTNLIKHQYQGTNADVRIYQLKNKSVSPQ
jgi:16S rRNA G1207 methylase RsmC